MKKLSSIFLLIVFANQLAFCQETNSRFVLVGNIINPDSSQKATLINTLSNEQASVDIKDGRFLFTGRVEHPCLALIVTDRLNSSVGVWLSNDTLQADFRVIRTEKNDFLLQTNQVKGPSDAVDHLQHFKKLLPLYEHKQYQRISDEIREYVGQHRDSFYSIQLLSTYITVIGGSTAKELFALISPKLKQSRPAVILAQRIQTAESNTLGKAVEDFALPDTNNQVKKLSNFIKPYTLIHFWASWCKPCREHNPELVELYRNNDRNKFQLIGVSLDENKQAWLKAIQKDGLSWVHLSDLKGFDSRVAKKFSLAGIPYVILINQDYKILATTLDDAKRLLNSR